MPLSGGEADAEPGAHLARPGGSTGLVGKPKGTPPPTVQTCWCTLEHTSLDTYPFQPPSGFLQNLARKACQTISVWSISCALVLTKCTRRVMPKYCRFHSLKAACFSLVGCIRQRALHLRLTLLRCASHVCSRGGSQERLDVFQTW